MSELGLGCLGGLSNRSPLRQKEAAQTPYFLTEQKPGTAAEDHVEQNPVGVKLDPGPDLYREEYQPEEDGPEQIEVSVVASARRKADDDLG